MRAIGVAIVCLFPILGTAGAADVRPPNGAPPSVVSVAAPVTQASYWERYQTMHAALIGFVGLIAVTAWGFRQNRKASRTQFGNELRAQREHWAEQRRLQEMEWREQMLAEERRHQKEAKSIAAALLAELDVLHLSILSFIQIAGNYAKEREACVSTGRFDPAYSGEQFICWEFQPTVLPGVVDKIGVLPPALASEVVRIIEISKRRSTHPNMADVVVPDVVRSNLNNAEGLLPQVEQAKRNLADFYVGNGQPQLPLDHHDAPSEEPSTGDD